MRQGADRAPLKERGHDCYETPACMTLALLRNECLPKIYMGASGLSVRCDLASVARSRP